MSQRAIRGPIRYDNYRKVAANHTIVNAAVIVTDTTAAALTLTLPPSKPANPQYVREIIVIDGTGQDGTNNVTVVPAGTDTINGGSSLVISANYAIKRFYDLGGGNWVAG